jgi:pyridoxine 5'-phosphate synthase PdxJ
LAASPALAESRSCSSTLLPDDDEEFQSLKGLNPVSKRQSINQSINQSEETIARFTFFLKNKK